MTEQNDTQPVKAETSAPKRRWAKRFGWVLALLLVPLVLGAVFIASPIGKRFIADQIAQVAPASGLRFEVGRIEGDLYNDAVLHDVIVKDPKGTFLTIPQVELDWRPLAWLWSGLDIRELTARRGTLQRLPELLPGDPDAPYLPDFDIRIDSFEIDNLTLNAGLAGEAAQRVDFAAKVDIQSGRALIDADGRFGPEDRIELLLDAEPDGDRFDLALDYYAADDGPIAALAGLDNAYTARIAGEGTWQSWLGHGVVKRRGETGADGQSLAGFRITNKAGTYGILGQIFSPLDDGSILDRALGDAVSLALSGTLEESVFDGRIAAVSSALDLRGEGAVDLAANRVDQFETQGFLRDPDLLGSSARMQDARFAATLAGPFRDLVIDHQLNVVELDAAATVTARGLAQSGVATFDGETWRVPLNVTVEQAITGFASVDPRLRQGTMSGQLTYAGGRLDADNTAINFPGLDAVLTLRGNTTTGAYAIAGPVNARNLAIENVGQVSANTKIVATFGPELPWALNANLSGVVNQITNASIANVAGNQVRFDTKLSMGAGKPIVLRDAIIGSDKLYARLDSRTLGTRTSLSGSGEHNDYGAFTVEADLESDGPRATLVLADPYPDAGLSDVRVAIAPSADGFALDVAGGSLLGPFEGALGLVIPADGPTQVAIDALQVYRTRVTGALILQDAGIAGDLALNGGGISGSVQISPGADGEQSFAVDLTANRARFGGDTVIALGQADINARGTFGGASTTINADISGRGLEYGALSLASFSAQAAVVDGNGEVQASIAGRRADRFALKLDGNFTPERIGLIAQGDYAGRPITMPRRAVLTAIDGGGYRLAPTQIGYARGYTIVEGEVGGEITSIEAQMARMPLRLADLAGADLGLGGRVSGVLNWRQRGSAPPIGDAQVRIDDFTRSGLVLSSRPIDVFVVGDLSPSQLAFGARLRDGDEQLGEIETRITGMATTGTLSSRITSGRLNAQLGYEGPAQSLWRLAAIETFDLTGPLAVTARATGTLANPRITGNLSSDDLRLQSAISGTDITNVSARGRFAGSRLELTRFAGSTSGGGTVSGSGTVDLADISASRGPQIDIRAAAASARLLNANGLDAVITGPLRIVSNGVSGAIAGRVTIDRASWELGVAAEDLRLPTIATREINLPDRSEVQSSTTTGAWRYLVNARAPSRVAVDGLGLDSEWGVDIALRGTVDDPRIGGEARLVRGDYTFAGTRFELTEGRITFDENRAIDPRLNITAEAAATDTDVSIAITGNAQTPEIAFSSTPVLPQEEILARLLFGGSVTSLSATDAIQLGAAVAALQGGGGGLDPIGTLRQSIGLDQLRIVSADPALGRGTGVALGKNLGRRVYVELITDGQGYSATQIEYRVTRWLALLGTVTTVGRDSVLAEISRDY